MPREMRIVECVLACAGMLIFGSALQNAVAQDSTNLPYLNPQLAPEQRTTDLVRRMTLAESVEDAEQLGGGAAAQHPRIPMVERGTAPRT